MSRVYRGEQFLLAQKFVIVLLRLRIEARVMIRVIGLGSRRGAKKGLVKTADAAAAGVPVPAVVAAVGISVTVADKSCSARFLWREYRVKRKQPEPACLFEVGIDRQRLDLSAPDQIVPRIVADLDVV